MSDLMDISRGRHTVRSYADRPVEPEKLASVLEAGRWAPTAVNAQPQRIVVLNTPENLAKVREFCTFGWQKKYVDLASESDTPEHDRIVLYYGAPVVLLVCYDRNACWSHPQTGETSGATDATIVATHMMLEAASIGLGSAWISYFDHDKARELLDVPESWEMVCMLYLGYEAEGATVHQHLSGSRKPLDETCFFNKITQRGVCLEKTMRAMQISDVTPATEAVMSEVSIPQVKPGWVLVRVRGIGMNHSEWELRHDEIRESYIAHPIIPGIEGWGRSLTRPTSHSSAARRSACSWVVWDACGMVAMPSTAWFGRTISFLPGGRGHLLRHGHLGWAVCARWLRPHQGYPQRLLSHRFLL